MRICNKCKNKHRSKCNYSPSPKMPDLLSFILTIKLISHFNLHNGLIINTRLKLNVISLLLTNNSKYWRRQNKDRIFFLLYPLYEFTHCVYSSLFCHQSIKGCIQFKWLSGLKTKIFYYRSKDSGHEKNMVEHLIWPSSCDLHKEMNI